MGSAIVETGLGFALLVLIGGISLAIPFWLLVGLMSAFTSNAARDQKIAKVGDAIEQIGKHHHEPIVQRMSKRTKRTILYTGTVVLGIILSIPTYFYSTAAAGKFLLSVPSSYDVTYSLPTDIEARFVVDAALHPTGLAFREIGAVILPKGTCLPIKSRHSTANEAYLAYLDRDNLTAFWTGDRAGQTVDFTTQVGSDVTTLALPVSGLGTEISSQDC
jgi:hypothetical protein